ncbi:MAG: hypothetical protein L0H03_01610 [Rhodococcus sp. (in: high G+C Gram-positive bacteria)]|nr:hypothetical protein [Rhodococcus sp. (in: high G+C Gram-positive bacteria)]
MADFFEPSTEEREQGIKTPSRGHLAIAELVKRGSVRVIVTTNFDRLKEQALDAVGIAAQVIARPEAVNGMKPLNIDPLIRAGIPVRSDFGFAFRFGVGTMTGPRCPSCSTQESSYRAGHGWSVRPQPVQVGHSRR